MDAELHMFTFYLEFIMVYNLKLSYILKDGKTEECELKLFT